MNAEQLATLLTTRNEMRDVRINQADNGFTIVGTRRFADRETGVVDAQLERQAVATTADAALATAQNFFHTGDFRGQYVPAPQPVAAPPQPPVI